MNKKEVNNLYTEYQEALDSVAIKLKEYINSNPHFSRIGNLMLQAWEV